jgi:hypothetical protein
MAGEARRPNRASVRLNGLVAFAFACAPRDLPNDQLLTSAQFRYHARAEAVLDPTIMDRLGLGPAFTWRDHVLTALDLGPILRRLSLGDEISNTMLGGALVAELGWRFRPDARRAVTLGARGSIAFTRGRSTGATSAPASPSSALAVDERPGRSRGPRRAGRRLAIAHS